MALPDPTTYPRPPGQTRPWPKPTKVGKVQFDIASHGLTGETTYEIYGDLNSGKTPLIVLHGGPGIPSAYLRPISLLAVDFAKPVIIYDQIGCGNSTHFPDRNGDASLWRPELFLDELQNLISELKLNEYDLLGHSFGGMLAVKFAASMQPKGLRKLVISGSPASIPVWEKVANEFLSAMPKDVQDLIRKHEEEGTMHLPENQAVMEQFNARHLCRLEQPPAELSASIESMFQEPTVTMTMFGISDFNINGSIRELTVLSELKKLTPAVVPGGMLLVYGQFEIASDECVQPLFDEPSTKVKWVQFALSAHMPHLEETEAYIKTVGRFLCC